MTTGTPSFSASSRKFRVGAARGTARRRPSHRPLRARGCAPRSRPPPRASLRGSERRAREAAVPLEDLVAARRIGDVHHVAVDLEIAGPVLRQDRRRPPRAPLARRAPDARRMRARAGHLGEDAALASTSFTWWWTPEMRCLGLARAARDHEQRHLLGVGARDRVHDVVAAGAVRHARRRRAGACCARSRRPRSRRRARARTSRSRGRGRGRSGGRARARDRPAARTCASRRRASGTRRGSRRAPCAGGRAPSPRAPRSPACSAEEEAQQPRHHERVVDLARARSAPRARLRGTSTDLRLLGRARSRLAPCGSTSARDEGVDAVRRTAPGSGSPSRAARPCRRRSRSPRAARARPPRPAPRPGRRSRPGSRASRSREPWRHWRTITTWSRGVSATTFTQSSAVMP